MLSYFELRKGTIFLLESQPYEVLEFQQVYKAQDAVVARTKIKNLLSGKIVERTFHKGDSFEEAEFEKLDVKFVYANRGKFVFSEASNPANRFELEESQAGDGIKFLKAGQLAVGVKFQGKIVNIILPIKVQLKVTEAPPGTKGDRAQSGTKSVTLETGAQINVPLFVEMDDVIEVNTETGEYVRRVEQEG
ncbi:MAG: elongation factor P [Candidatus Nealsonbacteria bacterium]|nr:elongation factor P [Candidatus Nealsonbacteria bacterium]